MSEERGGEDSMQTPENDQAAAVVDIEARRRMRQKVEERVAAEEEQYGSGGDDGGEPDDKFVKYCLAANELGDGELFCRLHRDQYLFDKAAGNWLVWSGHHWQVDRMETARAAVESLAAEYGKMIPVLKKELSDCGEEEEGKKIRIRAQLKAVHERIRGLRTVKRRTNCLQMAHQCENPVAVDGKQIDCRPWKLACANGVIDLRTGELHPGRREDYLCKASPVEWHGIDADYRPWEDALTQMMDGNRQLVGFLQRSLGMSLIGEVMASAFFVWSGVGRNGKSVIAETICNVLGPLAGAIRSEMLLDQGRVASAGGPTPHIMRLRGLRIAFASETDDGCKISPSQVKWLTGRDRLVGRGPYDRLDIDFEPTHTLFLLTNHKPQAPVDDFAFWERMHLTPFPLSFVNRDPRAENERRANPNLPNELAAIYPGILAWLVIGCLEFQRGGLQPPPAVLQATEDYKRDEDLLADFIAECLEVTGDENDSLGSTKGHEVFSAWWKRRVSARSPSLKRFGGWMKKRFTATKKGTVAYIGVRLSGDGQTYLDGNWSGG